MSLAAYQDLVLEDDPDLYWPLSDASGPLVDLSGNGLHGTLGAGSPTYRSRSGPIEGDPNEYLELHSAEWFLIGTEPAPLADNDRGYMECWVQYDRQLSVDGSTLHLFSCHVDISSSDNPARRMTWGVYDHDPATLIAGTSTIVDADPTSNLLTLGRWHMLGWNIGNVGGSNRVQQYVDGELVLDGPGLAWWDDIAHGTRPREWIFGAAYTGAYGQWYDGAVAHFSIYDHPLTPGRIRERFCTARPADCGGGFRVGSVPIGASGGLA